MKVKWHDLLLKPINLWSLPMSSNPVTGDSLVSKVGNKEQQEKYADGFDRIFRKKKDPICNVCGKTLSTTKECAWTGCQLNWDEDRVDIVGQNGNDGSHYENSN
jgi:hypothetical protein